MATRAALVRAILKELGVWQTGQDLPPEDYRAVDEELPYKLAAMAKARVYVVDDVDVYIPDEAVSELARYLAGEYTGTFGIAGEELAEIKNNAGLADAALRFQRSRLPTYARMKIENF